MQTKTKNYSNFVKTNVLNAYHLMMDYIQSEDIENEDTYITMRQQLNRLKVGIPHELYTKIETFANTELDPIIYEHDTFFAEMYSENFGFFDEENCFHVKEDAKFDFFDKYLKITLSVQNKLEDFGKNELYPVLML